MLCFRAALKLLAIAALSGCNLSADEAVMHDADAESRSALAGKYSDDKDQLHELRIGDGLRLEYIGPVRVILSANATRESRILFRQNVRYKAEDERALRPSSNIARQLDEMARQSIVGGEVRRRDRWQLGVASLGGGWYLAQTLKVHQLSIERDHVPQLGEFWLLHSEERSLTIYPTEECAGVRYAHKEERLIIKDKRIPKGIGIDTLRNLMVDCINGRFLKRAAEVLVQKGPIRDANRQCSLGMFASPNGDCVAFWHRRRVFYDCDEVLSKVIRVTREQLGLPLTDPVDIDTRIRRLGPDLSIADPLEREVVPKLEFVELMLAIQDELRVNFVPEIEASINTVGDVVRIIQTMKGCAKGSPG